jgi:hypothetical protein
MPWKAMLGYLTVVYKTMSCQQRKVYLRMPNSPTSLSVVTIALLLNKLFSEDCSCPVKCSNLALIMQHNSDFYLLCMMLMKHSLVVGWHCFKINPKMYLLCVYKMLATSATCMFAQIATGQLHDDVDYQVKVKKKLK